MKSTAARRATRSFCSIARAAGIPRSGVWMGYERKRGKLADLNSLLRGGAAGPLLARRRRDRGPVGREVRDHPGHGYATAARFGAAVRGSHGASAESPALRRRQAACLRGVRHPAAARGREPARARTGRGTRGCAAASPASIPIRAPSPTSTRTCSAKARSSARGSTTSMPSSGRSAGAFPRTGSSATTCWKDVTRARGC